MANRDNKKGNYAKWQPVQSADFDQNYEPISPNYPAQVSSTYTVRNGDTLQNIARSVWGDASMWYLIADVNGLTSGSALTAGQVLTIPNKVSNIHNNAGTFRPYNPGEAIGDLNPTISAMPKPPKSGGCGGIGMIIAAVVAVVATIVTAGALAPAAGGVLAGAVGSSTLAIGAVAGAVGSVAGQLAGMALGVQDKFSWAGVAAGAIGGAIGGGVAPFGKGATGLAGIGNAMAGNVINQGIGIITGQQKGFSWSSVAAAAIAAPITSSINQSIKGSDFAKASPLNAGLAGAAAGVATSAVNELTRVALQGGKLNWSSVAIGGIQGGIYGYGEGLNAKANALNQPVYADKFDTDRNIRTQMLGMDNNTATDTPSVLRLSDDEVINNALARQANEKNFNGLNVSYVDSPAQQNASNGGLNVSYGTALGEGVVYGKEQYMQGMPRTAGAGDVRGRFESLNSSQKVYSDSEGVSWAKATEKALGLPEDSLKPVYGTKIFHGRDFRTHQNVGAVILSGYFTEKQIANINIGHVNIDADQYQTEKYSFMHAMSGRNMDGTLQTPAQARIASNNFVREQFNLAWKYQDLGRDDLAMQHFGFALHTLQDSTSPEHNGFQKWTVYENKGLKLWNDANHGIGEAFNPDSLNSNFAHATLTAVGIYLSREIPKGDLFVYKADQKNDKYQSPYSNLNLSIGNLR